MQWIKENAKAVVAGLTALSTWAATALIDNELTAGEAVAGICGVGIATFSVWVVTNAPSAEQLNRLAEAVRSNKRAR